MANGVKFIKTLYANMKFSIVKMKKKYLFLENLAPNRKIGIRVNFRGLKREKENVYNAYFSISQLLVIECLV